MRSDKTLLLDMLIAARNIVEFGSNLAEAEFKSSKLHQSAVIREIQVIGEAARLVSETTKRQYPQIQWAAISGMRNRVIHEYFRADANLVWETIQVDAPELIQQLEPLFPPDAENQVVD